MRITVKYQNNTVDAIETSLLDELIASHKIKQFLRAEGWVTVGTDPIRGSGGSYEGPDRRQTTSPSLKPDSLSRRQPARESIAKYAVGIVETLHQPLLVLDAELKVLSANKGFYGVFKATPEETLGRSIYDLGNRQWDIPELRMLLDRILPENTSLEGYEVEHAFPKIGSKKMLLNARGIYKEGTGAQTILLAIEDISALKTRADELAELEERYRHTFQIARDGLILLDKQTGGIIDVNGAFTELVGYSKEELIGKSLLGDSGILSNVKDFQNIAWQSDRFGYVSYGEVQVESKDGRSIDTEIYFINKSKLVLCNVRDITQHKVTRSLLDERENRLRTIIESEPECVKLLAADCTVIEMNPAGLAMIEARSPEQIIGKSALEIIDPQYRQAFLDLTERVFRGESGTLKFEITSLRGAHRWLETHAAPLLDSRGNISALLGITRDITERRLAEEALAESKSFLDKIINSIADPIFVKDRQHRFVLLNDSFCSFMGYRRDELLWKSDYDFFPTNEADIFCSKDEIVFTTGEENINDEQLTSGDGVVHSIVTKKTLYTDERGAQFIVGIMQDITGRKKLEETIRHQAFYDNLTELPNRRLFTEHLTLEMAEAKRNSRKLAVMFLDLDRFKAINDTLGHAEGDKLLKNVAHRLKSCIRASDRAARIGGDEFNIFVSDITDSEEAAISARKILAAVNKPYIISGHELNITTSIGISMYPDDGQRVDDLMRNADMAMYHAKEKGRNTFRFYDPAMNVRTRERMSLEHHLRRSIDRGELLAYYQPQVDVVTGKITCVEALIRWQHPTLGLLSPARFLPLAEETRLILAIDSWMLRTACSQNKAWQKAGLPPICVSVNLSARQFQQPNLVDIVLRILRETDLSPQHLELEITENTAMHDIEMGIPNLTKLTDLGVSFSIDNFGIGYTSLSWLRKLPIRKLKIDKSLIRDVEGASDGGAIINAIIALAHNLKLKVVAEGVESQRGAAFLRSSGCDEMQGYAVSEALSASEIMALMSHEGSFGKRQSSYSGPQARTN